MSHIVQTFDTFAEASDFSRHTAKQQCVELKLIRADDGRWQVFSNVPLEVADHDEFEARLTEAQTAALRAHLEVARLQQQLEKVNAETDAQTAALHAQVARLQQQLEKVNAEKEHFRQRVIQHESKTKSEVAESLPYWPARKPMTEAICGACGRTLTFCRCAG